MVIVMSPHGLLFLSVSAAAAVAATSSPPRAHELDASYTFEQYLAHFDKAYPDPDEYARRSRTFDANLRTMLRHNAGRMTAAGDVVAGYVMGVNALTDVEAGELPLGYNRALTWSSQFMGGASSTERMLGAIGMKSYSEPPDFEIEEVEDLPEAVDWAAAGMVNPVVPNQDFCGSCWTFAATAAIESQAAIANRDADAPFIALSQQSMLDCAPNPDHCGGEGKCTGATVELGLNYIADATARGTGGMFALDDVPYTGDDGPGCEDLAAGKRPTVGIEGWTKLPTNDYRAVMNALAKVGPLAIAVGADNWNLYEKGIFKATSATVNHAVLLVGYGIDEETGEKFYKVRNSWGTTFGENGYIRLQRTDDDSSRCTTDKHPLLGVACALDDNGNTIDVEPVEVCGTSALLFDVSYPKGVHSIK